MYDEIVKRLRNCLSDTVEDCAGCPYQGGYKGTYCMNGLITEAADAIEELSKRVDESIPKDDAEIIIAEVAKPRWIPVSERLPESGVPTLICGDGNVVEQGFFDDEHGYWYDGRGYMTFAHHWMPLPQPPQNK